MKKSNLDRQWKLRVMNPLTLKMQELRTVDLPHDYCIEQKMDPLTATTASNAYLPGGVIEYEKTIAIPEDWMGQRIAIAFDGVYMNATVRLNKNIVGKHSYGYTSFICDVTPFVHFGEDNVLLVHVNNNALPNSRWYSGMGIYRHVWLLTGGRAHIEPWGTWVTTPVITKKETLFSIQTKVNVLTTDNETVTIRQTLLNERDGEVGQTVDDYTIASGSPLEATQTIKLENAEYWDIDHPYLYTVKTEIIVAGEVIDVQETKTGVRHIAFNAKNGFSLNGKDIKLKGGCVHHDCGILGSASHDRIEYRKVELLKANGYNAVRCAHNPPSPAFLDACDQLGLLVIDEAFDCWNENKMTNDYSVFFADWWERDLSAMIYRDRNHPSIIMWSVGNEIPERDGRSNGYELSRRLTAFVKAIDPTRGVTNALCEIEKSAEWAERTSAFAEPLDVVGYNYLLARYEEDGKHFPARVICGTETFPMQAFEYWEAVEKYPFVIGDFVWTSLDYLGEAGIGRVREENDTMFVGQYPWSHANCGDIDLCGQKRPQSYYRDCVWGISQQPYLAVHNPARYGLTETITPWGWPDVCESWDWPAYMHKPITLDVYSRDDEVELFINAVSQGRKKAGKANKYTASYELVYEPGEVLCVGYINNKETVRTYLKTPSAPYQIKLMADRDCLTEGYGDIGYITAQIVDKDGTLVDMADNTLFLCAQGAGKLLAIGSANPKTDEPYTGNTRKCYRGRLLAVVSAQSDEGEIVVTASGDGLISTSITLTIKASKELC